MPLPSQCPMKFASMPEHLVDDAMDLLIFTSRIPKALDGFALVRILKSFHYFLFLMSRDFYLASL